MSVVISQLRKGDFHLQEGHGKVVQVGLRSTDCHKAEKQEIKHPFKNSQEIEKLLPTLFTVSVGEFSDM